MITRALNGSDDDRPAKERRHFNQIVRQRPSEPLIMPPANLERYRACPANTPFPMEYAFHLAGDLRGRTVVELGCGDGTNTVKIAAFGARTIAIDISDESLELSSRRAEANGVAKNVQFVFADAARLDGVSDDSVDLVFAIAVLHHIDIAAAAPEIRRVLKPGGRAIFSEPLAGPPIWRTLNRVLPKAPEVSEDERPLEPEQIDFVTRAVGDAGPSRYFGLTYRLVHRLNCDNWGIVTRSHRIDAWLLARSAFLRKFASPLVWCADKPR